MKPIFYIFFITGIILGSWMGNAYGTYDRDTFPTDNQVFSSQYQHGDSISEHASIVLPKILNLKKVKQKVVIAHASECISLSGTYTFDVFVDKKGKYLSHKPTAMDNQVNMAKYLSELHFEPGTLNGRPVSIWTEVVLDFGPNKE